MKAVFYALLSAGLLASVAVLLGNCVLRNARATLRRAEAVFLSLVLGSALLGGLVSALAAAGSARRSSIFALAALLLVLSFWRGGHRLPKPSPLQASRSFAILVFVFAFVVDLGVALAPPTDLEGTLVSDIAVSAREDGSGLALTPASALYLFAFVIGRHSGTGLAAWIFLLATTLGIRSVGERLGVPKVGAVAGLLFLLSPLMARAGTVATPAPMLAAAAVAVFLSIERRLVVPAILSVAFYVSALHPTLASRGVFAPWQEVTVLGSPRNGLLGPVFVLLPLCLVSSRTPAGRRVLLAAGVFSIPFFFTANLRDLLPALPFLCLALAISLSDWKHTSAAVIAAHALFSWPGFIGLYADKSSWRIRRLEWRPALRLQSEYEYLSRNLVGYHTGRQLEAIVPADDTIYTTEPFQRAYHTRRMAPLSDPAAANWILVPAGHSSLPGFTWRYDGEGWVLLERR